MKPTLAQYMAVQNAYNDILSDENEIGGKHAILVAVLERIGIRVSSRENAEKEAKKILRGDWRNE